MRTYNSAKEKLNLYSGIRIEYRDENFLYDSLKILDPYKKMASLACSLAHFYDSISTYIGMHVIRNSFNLLLIIVIGSIHIFLIIN